MSLALTLRLAGCCFGALWSISATASFDFCDLWDNTGCGLAAVPYLSPDNDSRVNLLLQQAERHHLVIHSTNSVVELNGKFPSSLSAYDIIGYSTYLTVQEQQESLAIAQLAELKNQVAALELPSTLLSPISSSDTMGEQCIRDRVTPIHQFITALQSDSTLSQAQRQTLATQRLALCSDGNGTPLMEGSPTLSTNLDADNPFSIYLQAANLFYQGKFALADKEFMRLTDSSQPWLAETSTYMLLRVALKQAQEHALDQYGFFHLEHADQQKIAQAKARLTTYLQHYPDGLYVQSAKGLARRIAWLSNDVDKLAEIYQQVLDAQTTLPALIAIIFELDQKLLENETFTASSFSPDLSFIQGLKQFRRGEKLTADTLTPLRSVLTHAQRSDELNYLALLTNYRDKKYAQVLHLSPPMAGNEALSLLPFSQQVVRGDALIALKRWNEAEQHWRILLNRQQNWAQNALIQSRLADILSMSGRVDAIFAESSPIKHFYIRAPFLFYASESQLRQQASHPEVNTKERLLALDTLLVNELLYARYAKFLQDTSLRASLPATDEALSVNLSHFDWPGQPAVNGYACPTLNETVQMLSNNPDQPRALNCLGEFFRTLAVDESPERLSAAYQLGNHGLHFFDLQQTAQRRMAGYLQVITDEKAPREDRSYALYRAVHCYAPSGNNHCGEEEIDLSTRKQWFQMLKKQYQDTLWGQKIKYYW